ncbi:MAG: glutaredoxin 3 [Deltaproteobacteria bacterium RIFCSPLOWO2_02_FULL_50_16]|nr:MAG: glutaredoxin 3 [Deltaproteobacteria bacterium RIFCSPHIGHO2_02_FULL_50_15]OGQ56290.1 MAG: glutaredoxin 3 [Deltaproteobacteria bacterium RIFCSPLOWO2_02_FULL_50_16]OGQ67449.1 MAG: glutaredoxin 3 [Deltaproteobacteria bacterium RIFCSPLOWO2_12_FULL_50_11]
MAKIKIYTASYCPYCRAAKALLDGKKIAYEEIDVTDDKKFKALIKRTGWKTVPQIFINNELVGGFQELQALEEKGGLDKKLKSA